jgi:hypothetical protein
MPIVRDEQHGALVLRHSRATVSAEYEEMIPPWPQHRRR